MSDTPTPRTDKMAPVQGYVQGIPWEMHLRAYNVYCKKYGPQPALIEGWCRGGFHVSELDDFIPGWRDELEELPRLRKELTSAHAELTKLRADNERWREAYESCESVKGFMTLPKAYWDDNWESQGKYDAAFRRYEDAQKALTATSSEPVVPWEVLERAFEECSTLAGDSVKFDGDDHFCGCCDHILSDGGHHRSGCMVEAFHNAMKDLQSYAPKKGGAV